MKKRMKLTELLILLLCASTCLTSCLSDKNPVDGTDTSGSDTAGQKIEEQVPDGGDITETDDASTVPPPVIITPPAKPMQSRFARGDMLLLKTKTSAAPSAVIKNINRVPSAAHKKDLIVPPRIMLCKEIR
jgi:hypothetical protein